MNISEITEKLKIGKKPRHIVAKSFMGIWFINRKPYGFSIEGAAKRYVKEGEYLIVNFNLHVIKNSGWTLLDWSFDK